MKTPEYSPIRYALMNKGGGRGVEYKGVDYSDSNRPRDRRFKEHRVEPKKGFRVSRIWELHDEIKRRILLGQKNTIIAEELKCSTATISNVRIKGDC